MKPSLRALASVATASAAAAAIALAAPLSAGAATRTVTTPVGISDAVFVQTNATTGNQILAYSRSSTGALSFVHAYSTGGKGWRAAGSVVDPLASQGALYYDATADLLIAVNAGSDTITSFRVNGDVLSRPQVSRAGSTPVSVTSHGSLVYVLDAGGTGQVRGFSLYKGTLYPINKSVRHLGLNASATPQFLNTPGQVGFTPGGSQLVVTTKANGSDIDVFSVLAGGLLSTHPYQSVSEEPVPFGFVFDSHDRLVVTEAGGSDVSTYGIDSDGSLTYASTVVDGQHAPCWISEVGDYYYVANAGSADISAYQVNSAGVASLISPNAGIAGTTDAGPIDLAGSADGQFLYVEAGGSGAIDEFSLNSDGTLSPVGSVSGLSATGIEGIVAA